MSTEQRETVEQMLRDTPFDLGGDVVTQRPLLEQMLTGHPLPPDVHTTTGSSVESRWSLSQSPVPRPRRDPPLARRWVRPRLGEQLRRLCLRPRSQGADERGLRRLSAGARAPIPAALDDATAAYRALLEREGGPGGSSSRESPPAVTSPSSCSSPPSNADSDAGGGGAVLADDRPDRDRRELHHEGRCRPQHHRGRHHGPGRATISTPPAPTRTTRRSARSLPISPACPRCSCRPAPARSARRRHPVGLPSGRP